MHRHRRVEVALGRAHLDRNGKRLDDLAGLAAENVRAENAIAFGSTISFMIVRSSERIRFPFIGRKLAR